MSTHLAERAVERVATPPPVRQGRLIAGVALLIGLAILVIVTARNWPFSELAVLQSLRQQAGSDVHIGGFRQTYFPHPGCVAEHVTFSKGAEAQPYISIQKLTIVGSYHGLLTQHLTAVRADGFRLVIDKQAFTGSVGTRGGVSIGEVIADGAQIVFPAEQRGQQPMVFGIPKLTLHDIAYGREIKFETTVLLPKPDAEVAVTGKFGPWTAGNTAQTRLSGSYAVHRLDLGSFAGLDGQLTAGGKFDGQLRDVKVEGSLDAPNFEVRQSKHPVHMVAEYDATVHGQNGDVDINAARAHFRSTTIVGAGTVSGEGQSQGKAVTAELSSTQARIEDLLWLFVSDNPPGMMGPIVFRAKTQLPHENRRFTEKIKLEGDFGISNAQYPNPHTQKDIDVLSARARGRADEIEDANDKMGGDSYDPGKVMSNLKGHVVLADGVANLENVSFSVPGAEAFVDGTYSLLTERVALHGHMRLEAELSKTTTGVKSVLLKMMSPFMHKSKHKVSVVAIRIGGTYGHPKYAVVPKAEK